MNQYLFLHRIQGPAMLLTFGVAALLDQWHILSFGRSWPLYLIVLGVVIVLVVLMMPQGIVGLANRALKRWQRSAPAVAPAEAGA